MIVPTCINHIVLMFFDSKIPFTYINTNKDTVILLQKECFSCDLNMTIILVINDLLKNISACLGSTHTKIGIIQGRFAWPMCMDNTQIRKATIFFF